MSAEIESIKPALSVVLDDGEFTINSVGPIGKAMLQAVLPLAASARKIVVISDGEMKVLKKSKAAENGAQAAATRTPAPAAPAASTTPPRAKVFAGEQPDPSPTEDVQDQFVADVEAGVTGEQAMGEQASPTPGPNDPVKVPDQATVATKPSPARRQPQIFQDAAAPPAPELAEAEMERLLAEAQRAEADAAAAAEQQRYQRQQAVQAGNDQVETPAEESAAAAQPRRRTRERTLATTGRPCGRCGGGGKIVGEAGFQGACPVCHGQGQVKTWDRALKVR